MKQIIKYFHRPGYRLQKCRESEERYRQLFENTPDAIFVHDLEGSIYVTNEACTTLTGYNAEELKHLAIMELLTEESWFIIGTIEQLLLTGEDADDLFEVKLVKKDKNVVFIDLSIRLIHDGRLIAFQCTARDVSEQKNMQENLQYYLQQTTRAEEEERKRIALELHDEAIQELIVLSRQLDLLDSRSQELSPENSLLLKESRRQTGDIIQSLRQLSQDLRPATLDRLGLTPAVGYFASEMTKSSGIVTKVNVVGNERRLPEEAELMLFRITQEALRNVWRHSQATKVEIYMEFSEQKIKVLISDDGKGFFMSDTRKDLAKDGKLGLAGMQERARLINGQLSIQSTPGKGTDITIEAPI